MHVSNSIALLALVLGVSLTFVIAAEEHSNDARSKKAAFPGAAVSSISGIVPAGYPRVPAPGYFPGHAAAAGYPYNAGIYSPHQYVPGHHLGGYPFATGYQHGALGGAYPFAAPHPFGAGYQHGAYPYNKFGHVASPFGYPYKPYDDGHYYPEKYEYPYASY